ncbi:MAG TPA: LLM class flavin-dependent oxidoreductase [Nitrososphaeraceae archaeon]|nr:LLM class flavin-dependent oxidoreductase [Nitrososphaeraceae archaeon]
MTQEDLGLQVAPIFRPTRERVGLIVNGANAAAAIKTIAAAEAAGVQQIWMAQPPWSPDVLTTLAAAAIKTSRVHLGTSIVPTYPRHPIVLAQQALSLYDIAPGRLRLGIGPSHRAIIEDMYGLPQTKPLVHLREYVKVLHSALWDGKVDHHGEFFNIVIQFPRTAQIPVLISTLGKKAFQLAGEIADGALSWMCPVPYLLDTGIPSLRKAATANGRSNPPPLVAHVLVALCEDHDSVMVAGHQMMDMYAKFPFYVKMFAAAGFPLTSDKKVTDDLVNNMIISGHEATAAASFTKLLTAGLDELMVSLVPIVDEDYEQTQLMRLIGQL